MPVEAQNLAREGVWVVGGVVIVSIIMLGILAIVHDGAIAATIAAQLVAAIQWGLPVLGVLVGVTQIAAAYVASRNAANTNTGSNGDGKSTI